MRRSGSTQLSVTTATVTFYVFNPAGKKIIFMFQNSKICLFFKVNLTVVLLVTNVWRFFFFFGFDAKKYIQKKHSLHFGRKTGALI